MASFENRDEAGRQLAEQLRHLQSEPPVVLAVPKGGISVAVPIAKMLNMPVCIVPIRSLVIPWQESTVYGYVTDKGDLHLNQPLVGQLRITPQEIYHAARKEQLSLLRDFENWGVEPPSGLDQKHVLIVDDGMHSGWTMFSAIETLKARGASQATVAVPVSHFRAKRFVGHHCHEIISILMEETALFSIASYYQDFSEITDGSVKSLLNHSSGHSDQPAC